MWLIHGGERDKVTQEFGRNKGVQPKYLRRQVFVGKKFSKLFGIRLALTCWEGHL